MHGSSKRATPLKFNIAPEKRWLEDYFPIGKVTFQGRAVKLWGGIISLVLDSQSIKKIPGSQMTPAVLLGDGKTLFWRGHFAKNRGHSQISQVPGIFINIFDGSLIWISTWKS